MKIMRIHPYNVGDENLEVWVEHEGAFYLLEIPSFLLPIQQSSPTPKPEPQALPVVEPPEQDWKAKGPSPQAQPGDSFKYRDNFATSKVEETLNEVLPAKLFTPTEQQAELPFTTNPTKKDIHSISIEELTALIRSFDHVNQGNQQRILHVLSMQTTAKRTQVSQLMSEELKYQLLHLLNSKAPVAPNGMGQGFTPTVRGDLMPENPHEVEQSVLKSKYERGNPKTNIPEFPYEVVPQEPMSVHQLTENILNELGVK